MAAFVSLDSSTDGYKQNFDDDKDVSDVEVSTVQNDGGNEVASKVTIAQAEVLILNFRMKNYTLLVFVDKMDNLKVLMITNYDIFPTELRNFHSVL